MCIKKIRWFVLLFIIIIISYGCQDTKNQNNEKTVFKQDTMITNNQKNDETVCNFFRGYNTDTHWETYRITSKQGLLEVDSWIERHIDYIEYPFENLAIRPDGEIYNSRLGKQTYYCIFNNVPIESIEELKDIAKKYGIEMNTEDFDLFYRSWGDIQDS